MHDLCPVRVACACSKCTRPDATPERGCWSYCAYISQAASSGADGGDTEAAAAAAEQLEKAFEERKVAQDSVREMAERYSALQEKFRHERMRQFVLH